MNAYYGHTRNYQIYGYDYHGATSVVQAVSQKTSSDNYGFGADGSKGLDWLQATLRAFCGYQYSQSEQLIGGILYPYHSRTVSFGAGGTITPLPWLNLVLSSGFSWNKSQTDREQDDLVRTIRSAAKRMKINIFVTK